MKQIISLSKFAPRNDSEWSIATRNLHIMRFFRNEASRESMLHIILSIEALSQRFFQHVRNVEDDETLDSCKTLSVEQIAHEMFFIVIETEGWLGGESGNCDSEIAISNFSKYHQIPLIVRGDGVFLLDGDDTDTEVAHMVPSAASEAEPEQCGRDAREHLLLLETILNWLLSDLVKSYTDKRSHKWVLLRMNSVVDRIGSQLFSDKLDQLILRLSSENAGCENDLALWHKMIGRFFPTSQILQDYLTYVVVMDKLGRLGMTNASEMPVEMAYFLFQAHTGIRVSMCNTENGLQASFDASDAPSLAPDESLTDLS